MHGYDQDMLILLKPDQDHSQQWALCQIEGSGNDPVGLLVRTRFTLRWEITIQIDM
jgi:hypothetical protein